MQDTQPWWIAVIAIPLVGLFIWVIKYILTGVSKSITSSGDAIVASTEKLNDTVEENNNTLTKFMGDCRVDAVEAKNKMDRIHGDLSSLSGKKSCHFSEVEGDMVKRAAKRTLRDQQGT